LSRLPQVLLDRRGRWIAAVLAVVAVLAALLWFWQLGATGLVDETPPLFAAAARGMAESGDWLTPRVNGLPRYDKPPLVYWLMAAAYALPDQVLWDPLGTWAARWPSAIGSSLVMLLLAFTLLKRPQPLADGHTPSAGLQALTAVSAALAFALSPLVLLWSRIAVSDAVFNGMLSASLLLFWLRYAGPAPLWLPWCVLALAVLAKGPVALVLAGLCLALFGLWQRDWGGLCRRLRPLPGLLITALLALPWYALELWVEGDPFWQSFFGYHNLQRFTGVVNNHLQPWWYFLPVLLVASLPFTPLLLAGLTTALRRWRVPCQREASLQRFATCWLLTVLVFFTMAATKLPSYWLPATPAAGLLIALAAQQILASLPRRAALLPLLTTLALQAVVVGALAASGRWVPLIEEPELPTLPVDLLASGLLLRAMACFALALLLGIGFIWMRSPWRRGWLLAQQLALTGFVLSALLPMVQLGDRLRQQPIRRIAAMAVQRQRSKEPLAMVGILKPSLLFYTDQVVIYEGAQPNAAINLSDRLQREVRLGQQPSEVMPEATFLLVIDERTARLPHWLGLRHQPLAQQGLFRLWRVGRLDLQHWAAQLAAAGVDAPDWHLPRPERY
jgi:4-amino-4-deoxy-L-arabinose transferase-like glycosyltransferase